MGILSNKIDFMMLCTVKNANPNGAQGAGVDPNATGAGTNNGANGDNGNVYDADYKVEDDNK